MGLRGSQSDLGTPSLGLSTPTSTARSVRPPRSRSASAKGCTSPDSSRTRRSGRLLVGVHQDVAKLGA
jgi:hypothetical protein